MRRTARIHSFWDRKYPKSRYYEVAIYESIWQKGCLTEEGGIDHEARSAQFGTHEAAVAFAYLCGFVVEPWFEVEEKVIGSNVTVYVLRHSYCPTLYLKAHTNQHLVNYYDPADRLISIEGARLFSSREELVHFQLRHPELHYKF